MTATTQRRGQQIKKRKAPHLSWELEKSTRYDEIFTGGYERGKRFLLKGIAREVGDQIEAR